MIHRRIPTATTRALLGIVCALLLFAQQVGLSHSVWHAAAPGEQSLAQAAGGDHDTSHSGAQRDLCAFHAALGATLGAHHGVCVPLAMLEADAVEAPPEHPERARPEAVPAVSRGPPVFL